MNNDDNDCSLSLPADGAARFYGALSGDVADVRDGRIQVVIKGNSGEIWIPMTDGKVPIKSESAKNSKIKSSSAQTKKDEGASDVKKFSDETAEVIKTAEVFEKEAKKTAENDLNDCKDEKAFEALKAELEDKLTQALRLQAEMKEKLSESNDKLAQALRLQAETEKSRDELTERLAQAEKELEELKKAGAEKEQEAAKKAGAEKEQEEAKKAEAGKAKDSSERFTMKSYEDGIIAGLQEAIIAIMEKNGYVTDQMRRDVYNNTYHDSLITWIKSFR